MTTQVNGGALPGEFVSSNLNFFTIVTVVPCYPTKVTVPLEFALKARNWTALSATKSITVKDANGASVTYTSNATYVDAFNMQKNLDALMNTFELRSNPLVVSVSSEAIADGSGATVLANAVNAVDFGSTYNGGQQIYTINMAIDKAPAWLMSAVAESNTNGWQFLNAINGVPALSTTAAVPAGPQNAAAAAVSVGGSAFVVSSGSNDRNIIGKVREQL